MVTYIRNERNEVAHPNAAWAQETGKGVLYYAKRAEDKASPTGLILLVREFLSPLAPEFDADSNTQPDATFVTKEGSFGLSFKVNEHTHKFEATSTAERDSWFAAIQNKVEETRGMKEEVTGRDSYKKTLDGYGM